MIFDQQLPVQVSTYLYNNLYDQYCDQSKQITEHMNFSAIEPIVYRTHYLWVIYKLNCEQLLSNKASAIALYLPVC